MDGWDALRSPSEEDAQPRSGGCQPLPDRFSHHPWTKLRQATSIRREGVSPKHPCTEEDRRAYARSIRQRARILRFQPIASENSRGRPPRLASSNPQGNLAAAHNLGYPVSRHRHRMAERFLAETERNS